MSVLRTTTDRNTKVDMSYNNLLTFQTCCFFTIYAVDIDNTRSILIIVTNTD